MEKNYAALNSEDLKIISEAQDKLSAKKGTQIALVAYDMK